MWYIATFDESTEKESIERFCAIASANKDDLTDSEKVMFLATYQAIVQTWTDLTRKYHEWLVSQMPD